TTNLQPMLSGNNYGAGFDKNPQNINRKGQPLSVNKRIDQMLKEGNGIIRIHEDKVKVVENEEGRFYEIEMPEFDAVCMKYISIMLGSDNKDASKLLMHYIDHRDGRAKQSVEHSGEIVAPVAPTIIFNTKKK
ncbi:MAG TPA: hypothetical protein PLD87_13185, partial [Bacteroidia bacterium]|nr:hypothetical protein [Bacteroidia bacterium]